MYIICSLRPTATRAHARRVTSNSQRLGSLVVGAFSWKQRRKERKKEKNINCVWCRVGCRGQWRLSSGAVGNVAPGRVRLWGGGLGGGTWGDGAGQPPPRVKLTWITSPFHFFQADLSSSFASWLPSPWLCWQSTLRVEPKTEPQGECPQPRLTRALVFSKPLNDPLPHHHHRNPVFWASNLTSVDCTGPKAWEKVFLSCDTYSCCLSAPLTNIPRCCLHVGLIEKSSFRESRVDAPFFSCASCMLLFCSLPY